MYEYTFLEAPKILDPMISLKLLRYIVDGMNLHILKGRQVQVLSTINTDTKLEGVILISFKFS